VRMTKKLLEKLQSSASKRPRYMPKADAIHYVNMYHSHKSRSRSSEVTVGMQRLHCIPSCQICSGSRNI